MASIHPTAIVDSAAELEADVSIGPYCIVGPNVRLGAGVVLHSHVVIDGRTTVGEGCQFFPFASIGLRPQDMKYAGEPSELIIGRNNIVRENVTMHPGTQGGGLLTRVGDNGLFMAYSHVAHDCTVGDNVILANCGTLAGHVQVGEFAIVGGLAAVHQFARIGRHAMIGGMSAVEQDVIPYGSVTGNRAHLSGLNLVGLKRRGFDREDIHQLRNAYRLLFAPEGTLQERLADVAQLFAASALVQEVVEFVRNPSSRGLCRPHPDAESV